VKPTARGAEGERAHARHVGPGGGRVGADSMASAVASSSAIVDLERKDKEWTAEGAGEPGPDVVTFHMLQVVMLGSFGGFLFGCAPPPVLPLPPARALATSAPAKCLRAEGGSSEVWRLADRPVQAERKQPGVVHRRVQRLAPLCLFLAHLPTGGSSSLCVEWGGVAFAAEASSASVRASGLLSAAPPGLDCWGWKGKYRVWGVWLSLNAGLRHQAGVAAVNFSGAC
jgi:hypothetical protein